MTNMPPLIAASARSLAQQGVAFAPQIASAAAKFGLDPRLLAAVAAQETGGPGANAGRNIVGDGGHGRGIFQIDDRFHNFARTRAAMEPQANADYAARMIAGLIKRYGGDVHKALSAYNAGDPNSQGTRTDWQDGRRLGYADSVLRHYVLLTGGTMESLTQTLAAESPYEQAGLNVLATFAALQPPAAPHTDRPWRDAAPNLASLIDDSASSE
jgi:soluble lytic murein transglycosylase-like protein